VWLAPHGGEEKAGITVSCGLQPKLSRFDAYLSAQHALDEAVRNSVATGADPDQICVIDNFCWPDPLPGEKNPDANHKLAQLVRANRGLYDLAKIYGTPFVSGKDSMKNDFIGRGRLGKEVKISVPPTVLVTAMGKVPDVTKTVTSDFQKEGDAVYLLGCSKRGLGGSELSDAFQLPGSVLQQPSAVNGPENLRLYRTLHRAIQGSLVRSCHDCSEGGMLVALAESAIGGMLGCEVELEKIQEELKEFGGSLSEFFFNESPGRFVVSVAPEKEEEFRKLFAGQHCLRLGEIHAEILRFSRHGMVVLDVPVREARRAWRGEQR
jgi:phosphoribosylformylglycinamidine synthase